MFPNTLTKTCLPFSQLKIKVLAFHPGYRKKKNKVALKKKRGRSCQQHQDENAADIAVSEKDIDAAGSENASALDHNNMDVA